MSSIPPPERRSTPPPLLRLSADAAETRLFFSVEGAPPQACTTNAWRAGISFDTSVSGEVTHTHRAGLELRVSESTVSLRHLLPAELDLAPLVGRWVSVRVWEHFEGGRWTRQLEIRDLRGRALLVARDGRLPRDGEVLGLTARVSLHGDRSQLAVGEPPHLRRLERGALHCVHAEGHPMSLLIVRLEASDAAMLWVAR